MWREIARLEIRNTVRSGLFAATTLFLLLAAFVAVSTDQLQIGGAVGAVHRNAPVAVVTLLGSISVFGLFLTTAFVAGAATRDFELGTAEVLFTTRLTRADYLLGRFAGASVVAVLAFLGASLGAVLGELAPWLDPERLGPFPATAHAVALAALVVPNLLVMGALLFSVAILTRRLLATYAVLVALLVAWGVSQNLLLDLELSGPASLLDPFGLTALAEATRYWTVFDRNARLPPFGGALLANRALWLGLASAALVFAGGRFSLTVDAPRSPGEPGAASSAPTAEAPPRPPSASPGRATRTRLVPLWHMAGLETRTILRGRVFAVVVLLAVVNTIANAPRIGEFVGTDIYPVTWMMVWMLQATFLFLLPVVVTFYAGEAVWRERAHGLHEVYGATPTPDAVFAGAKLAALFAVVLVFLGAGAATGVAVQLLQGYTHLEPRVYFQGLLVGAAPRAFQVATLALFLQVVSRHKYVGFFLMVVYLLSGMILQALGFEHALYRYGGTGLGPWSDMNGYGHFLEPHLWFSLYWSCAAVALAALSAALWPRGTEETRAGRLRRAARSLGGAPGRVLAAALAGFVAVGAWIYYNTDVLNRTVTSREAKAARAEYERRYARYRDLPQPKVTAARVELDFRPESRDADVRGRLTLANRTADPLTAVHVVLSPRPRVLELSVEGAAAGHVDPEHGYRIFDLEEPLPPGETIHLDFSLRLETRGFALDDPFPELVSNGSFLTNDSLLPRIGYRRERELADPGERRAHGLEPRRGPPDLDDPEAARHNAVATDADRIRFEAVVSTSPEQTAIAPGVLVRSWEDRGRRYFHYRAETPIVNAYAFLSAEYEVLRRIAGGVDVEVYHHAAHAYNVDLMARAAHHALDYMSRAFGPYPRSQLRIVEFPRYRLGAASFAGTVPFSEGLGFIADLRDERGVDYPYYVTAHEVAHEWWAHQLVPADVQGAALLTETLAQYVALMVMRQEYGEEKTRRFLRSELDRYLSSRGSGARGEPPLARVEDQSWVYYSKGSLAMMALEDRLGEAALNRALAGFFAEFAGSGPPWPTARDLLAHLRRALPPEEGALVEDLFETITLYDLEVTGVRSHRTADGRFRVRLDYRAARLRADALGRETPVPLREWVDVAVFGAGTAGNAGDVLLREKHLIESGEGHVEVVLDDEPSAAGLDPWNVRIDRNPDDNRRAVDEAG